MIICIYEYGPGVVTATADGPSTKVERKLWRFEIVTDWFVDKIAVVHRATVCQTRPTHRHKWQGAQGWHWNRGDVVNPRLMPANLLRREPAGASRSDHRSRAVGCPRSCDLRRRRR